MNNSSHVKTTGQHKSEKSSPASSASSSTPRGLRLGLLHSLTGTLAIAEMALVDAAMLAINEINSKGGILGQQIEPVIEDGASNWTTFAEKARKLLVEDNVAAVIGCNTSASRKAVLPVFHEHHGLLYYSQYYEGQEKDPSVFYTSQEATQSVIAATRWMVQQDGKTFYLVGSDYIYPRVCNTLAASTIQKNGAKVIGEAYVPLGESDFSAVVADIKRLKPDWIYSTVVGDSNIAFYKQLRAAGLDGYHQRLLTTVVQENEIESIGAENAVGYFSCAGYFQSIDSAVNARFVSAFKQAYGQHRVIGDPMQCSYNSVYLWKMAVEKANSTDVNKIIAASAGLELEAPEGWIRIHPTNRHVSKRIRIGRVREDGQFDIQYESDVIDPNPFPKL
jgi:urea transport system substrate-binding protein